MIRRWFTIIACWSLAMNVMAGVAGAQFPGRNGQIALAWYDSDAGAHAEAAWEITAVPWRTGSSTGHAIISCTMIEGCPAQYSSPSFSPDGTQVVWTATPLNSNPGSSQLMLARADGSRRTAITQGPLDRYDASFLSSGRGLVFVQSHRLASDTGVDPERQIVTSDLTGAQLTPVGSLRGSDPRFSPDGRHLLYTHAGGVWLADARGQHPRRLVAPATKGDFSPDGRSLLYISGAPLSGRHLLYLARLDGSGRHAVLAAAAHHRRVPIARVDQAGFSPDGTQIALAKTDPVQGNPEILRVPVGGGVVHQLWYAGLDAGGIDLGIAWQGG